MRSVLATGSLCFATYLLFAGAFSRSEVITAVVLTVLCAMWGVASRSAANDRFAFSTSHLRTWMRALGSLPGATFRTGVALAQAVVGRGATGWKLGKRPFRYGMERDPAERTRRATALLAASLAPASFVMRAEPDAGVALFHEIDGARDRHDPEWLA